MLTVRGRTAVVLAWSALAAAAVPAQTTPAIADSVCVSVVRPDGSREAQVLMQQCVLFVALTAPPSWQPPAPLPGTGRKAQAVAAMDSARWLSTFPQLLDSARADLTDQSADRTVAEKMHSAVSQLQVALVVALERMKALVARALSLLDAPATLPEPGPDPVPPVDSGPPSVPPPAEDTTQGPGGPPPTVPPVAGDPELPRAVPFVPSVLATAACTDTVRANLQGALNAATGGAVLCLEGRFVGNFKLPARASGGWVVVRSLASVALPGQRIRPALAAPLATVQGLGVAPTFETTGAAAGWYLRELNIEADSLPSVVYSLVTLQKDARDVVLDRVWVHPPAWRGNQRCVVANAAAVTIVESVLSDCHGKGFDSQAVITWDSPGPIRIENSRLEGAGENFMSGGADPSVPGRIPCDLTLRRNHVLTPAAWGGPKPTRWTKKNLLELKNACRVLIEGNVFEGSWGDAQTGFALVLKSSNQGGRCRWCGTSDVTVRRNLIIEAAAPLNISGTVPGTNPVDSATRRILVVENYALTGGASTGIDGRHLLFTGNSRQVTLRRNTWAKVPTTVGNVYTGSDVGNTTGTDWTIDGDLVPFSNYGVMGAWSPSTTPPGVVNLQVLGLAVYGPKATARQLPNMTVVASEAAGLAAGFGVARSVVEAATAGVVVP